MKFNRGKVGEIELETSEVQAAFDNLCVAYNKDKSIYELKRAWDKKPEFQRTIIGSHAEIASLSGSIEVKQWLLNMLMNDEGLQEDCVQESLTEQLSDIEQKEIVRTVAEHVDKVAKAIIKKKSDTNLSLVWEAEPGLKENLLQHHKLIRFAVVSDVTTEQRLEIVEWILRKLHAEVSEQDEDLQVSIHSERMHVQNGLLIERKGALDFKETLAATAIITREALRVTEEEDRMERPAFITSKRRYEIIRDSNNNSFLVVGSFDEIWKLREILLTHFSIDIPEEAREDFESGSSFECAGTVKLTVKYCEQTGLKVTLDDENLGDEERQQIPDIIEHSLQAVIKTYRERAHQEYLEQIDLNIRKNKEVLGEI